MNDDEKKTTDELGLKLIAGVFINTETQQAEIHVGEEGIDPIVVFADAVMRNMSMAISVQRELASGKPRVLRASGPLPKRKHR